MIYIPIRLGRLCLMVPLRTLVFAALVVAGLVVSLAHVHAGTTRTASWYAAHPAQRQAVLNACADDPGHLRGSPDCINARQGEVREAAAAARAHAGLDVPPSDPAYWRGNPDIRRELFVCSSLPPDQRDATCAAATAAAAAGASR